MLISLKVALPMRNWTENEHLCFECGCKFKVVGPPIGKSLLPAIKFQADLREVDHDINFECKATYDLLSSGLVKGVFQLEKPTGIKWVKILKPTCIDDVIALGSLLRPGALHAIDEKGVSATKHYCNRKNGLEENLVYHEALQDILAPTYQVLCYQEQSLLIAQKVAGFNLQEADALRKAIGKKLAEEMAKAKKLFLEKANQLKVVTPEQAEYIFSQIEESQRYQFNKSHSDGYGKTGYISAYIKAHFPVAFYFSWLRAIGEKGTDLQEIRDLVVDSRLFDVEILPPDLRQMEPSFCCDGKTINFGLTNIKDVGGSHFSKLQTILTKEAIANLSWLDFLIEYSDKISSKMIEGLIQSGALRYFNMQRQRMLAEYKSWTTLTGKYEHSRIQILHKDDKFNALAEAYKALLAIPNGTGAIFSDNRRGKILSELQLLEDPPTPLTDTYDWIAYCEETLLGVAITCGKVDEVKTFRANTTCLELVKGFAGYAIVFAEVISVRKTTTKKGENPGQPMGIIMIEDNTINVELVVFPKSWAEFSYLLVEGAKLYINIQRLKDGGYSLQKAWQT